MTLIRQEAGSEDEEEDPIHSLRHYYITRLVESGLSIDEVKKLARHGSITTTQQYFHADADRMRQGVESLPKLSLRSA